MKIIKQLIDKIKNLDKNIVKIMDSGFIFSFILCIISAISLFTYNFFYSFPNLFYIGIGLFKTSLMFATMFFICGIGFDTIKKEIT